MYNLYTYNYMSYHICILDFEATCWEDRNDHEIIEFPSILLKWTNNSIEEISRIQIFVKPKNNPILSEFCSKLTGITQQQIDNGVNLESAINQHFNWIKQHSDPNRTTIVTCGHWDIKTMLYQDLKNNNISYPHNIYSRYANIKQLFCLMTNNNMKNANFTRMMAHFDMKIEGRHHSGIDDCHNIARIFCKLVNMGLSRKIFKKYEQHLFDNFY